MTHHKTTVLFLASLMIVAALGVVACRNTTDLDQKNEEGGADAVLHLIVYGKVDSIHSHKHQKAVIVTPHSYDCSDSTGSSDAVLRHQEGGPVDPKSGTYRFPITTPPTEVPGKQGKEHCFTVKVVEFLDSDLKHERVIAGPKKFGEKFLSRFRIKSPLDSVRVDFTVPDSTFKGN